ESLSMEIQSATAIPSSEYTRQNAKILEDRFKNKHIVTLYIGDSQVLVSIKFTDCKVTEEGKTSMLAFLNSDEDILKDYNETYKEN
ncbi:hypothetical protein, partial [Microbacterium sp. ZXX196]